MSGSVLQLHPRQLPLFQITGSGLTVTGGLPYWFQAVDLSYPFYWNAHHTFEAGLSSSGSITLFLGNPIYATGSLLTNTFGDYVLNSSNGSVILRTSGSNRIQIGTNTMTIHGIGGSAVFDFSGSENKLNNKLLMNSSSSILAIGNVTSGSTGTGIWIDTTGLYLLNNDSLLASLTTACGLYPTAGIAHFIQHAFSNL